MSKQLPERPNLDHLRKQAKDLLAAARKADPSALERFKILPIWGAAPQKDLAGKRLGLHDAHSVIAREYGFESWPKLASHVETARAKEGITPEVAKTFVRLALGEGPGNLPHLLELYPKLPGYDMATSLVYGDEKSLEAWLKDHSPHEALDPMGWKPLEYVCWSQVHRNVPSRYNAMETCARILLQAGADPNTSHNFQQGENSPLSVLYGATCQSVHEGIARLLLEKGAKPDDGESVYHATQLDLRNMLDLLVQNGADISFKNPHWGNTPLYFNAGHRLSDSGYERAMRGCEWLLEHGADPNVRSYECQETPLFPAARNANVRLAAALLKHGADPNVKNEDGLTPYMFAVVLSPDVADLLAAARADTSLPPQAQFLADCASGKTAKVRAALKAKPDLIDELGDKARSSIVKLAELGNTKGVKACLDAGIPIDSTGKDKATALHYACYCQWPETALLLIQRGAPLELQDATYNGTPLGWALEGFLWNRNPKGDGISIVKALLAASASDENLRSRLESDNGENPAMIELVAALNA